MRRIIKTIISTFVVSAIPALLSYLANSSLVFDKLKEIGLIGNSINIQQVQDYCLWIGIVFSALFLSLNLVIKKLKYDEICEQRNSLIIMNKAILSESLGQRFLSEPSAFDIRIFIPKYPRYYKIADKLKLTNVRRKFKIKNIDLIADRGITKDLEFEVYPKQEGLVGLCYKEKKMFFDDDLEHTNSEIYELHQNQIDRTSGLKWSICSPVIDSNDEVIAIMALDGKTKLKIDDEKETALRDNLLAFSIMLYESVPKFFKR